MGRGGAGKGKAKGKAKAKAGAASSTSGPEESVDVLTTAMAGASAEACSSAAGREASSSAAGDEKKKTATASKLLPAHADYPPDLPPTLVGYWLETSHPDIPQIHADPVHELAWLWLLAQFGQFDPAKD